MPPAMGASPPWTPHFPTLVGFGFASVLGPTRGRVANAGNSPPYLGLWGDTPHAPRHGDFAPWTPFAHLRRLWVRQRSGPHSWPGC